MSEMGKAMMGTGEAEGDNRAIEAAEKAISNPLLDGVSMKGAKGVIISITGGEDMRLMEVDEAASHIKELVDPDANIIWGSAFNNDLGGKICVSVVATGIEAEVGAQPAPAKVFSFPARQAAVAAPAQEASARDETPDTEATANEDGGDELLLDADDILTSPVGSPPIVRPRTRTTAPGDRDHRRHPVRADVEHRPRRVQGADRRGRRWLSARADRHPALPQPAKQPVIGQEW